MAIRFRGIAGAFPGSPGRFVPIECMPAERIQRREKRVAGSVQNAAVPGTHWEHLVAAPAPGRVSKADKRQRQPGTGQRSNRALHSHQRHIDSNSSRSSCALCTASTIPVMNATTALTIAMIVTTTYPQSDMSSNTSMPVHCRHAISEPLLQLASNWSSLPALASVAEHLLLQRGPCLVSRRSPALDPAAQHQQTPFAMHQQTFQRGSWHRLVAAKPRTSQPFEQPAMHRCRDRVVHTAPVPSGSVETYAHQCY